MSLTKPIFSGSIFDFFGGIRRIIGGNPMNEARQKIKEERAKMLIADGLRKWQKQGKKNRISLSCLAKQLGTTVPRLRSMLRTGPRRPRKRGLEKKSAAVVKPRTVRRLTQGVRRARKEAKAAHYKEWHRNNPNEEDLRTPSWSQSQ